MKRFGLFRHDSIKFYFWIFVVLLFLSFGCSKNSETLSDSSADGITGHPISKIYRSCKYDNGGFCEELCCKIESKCHGGSDAYRRCNLETGEWKNSTYSDLKCSTECNVIQSNENKITDIIRNDIINETIDSSEYGAGQKCQQGWKCINANTMKFQIVNCSFIAERYCETGCTNNSCARLCNPGNLMCKGSNLRICDEDGNYYSLYKECGFGCANNSCIGQNATNESMINQTQNPDNATHAQPSQNDYISDKCINVIKFNYTGGNSATDEYFTIKNSCSYSIDTANWTAKDEGEHVYIFPKIDLVNAAEISVVTGPGTSNSAILYWGRGSAVWNNNGDTLYLNASNGASIFICRYNQTNQPCI